MPKDELESLRKENRSLRGHLQEIDRCSEAEALGTLACKNRVPRSDNPYSKALETSSWLYWDIGWNKENYWKTMRSVVERSISVVEFLQEYKVYGLPLDDKSYTRLMGAGEELQGALMDFQSAVEAVDGNSARTRPAEVIPIKSTVQST